MKLKMILVKYSDIEIIFQEERKKQIYPTKEMNEKCFGSASNGGGMASNILTSYKRLEFSK